MTSATFNGQTENEIISRNWKRSSLLRTAVSSQKHQANHWAPVMNNSKKGSAIRAYAESQFKKYWQAI